MEIRDTVDYIFIPRILSSVKNHISCPKLSVIPDCASILAPGKILSINIDEKKETLAKTLERFAISMGFSKKTAKQAITRSFITMKESITKKTLELPSKNGFLLTGHPYNLYDTYISDPVVKKLKKMGVEYSIMPFKKGKIKKSFIKWDTCSEIHETLSNLDPDKYHGVIQISSFNCGCDSVMNDVFRKVLKDKNIHYLVLVIDEHSALAGVDTRLEAFIDSVEWANKSKHFAKETLPTVQSKTHTIPPVSPGSRLAIPNMGNYSIAFAAIADAIGVTPWVSQTTPEIMKLGIEASPDSLCLPFKTFIGHFIKAAREGVEFGIMVDGEGPCRLRYYRKMLQEIIDKQGLKMHIFGLGTDAIKPEIIKHFDPPFFKFWRGAYWAMHKMFVIDMVERESWTIRPREITKGSTTELMNQCLNELKKAKTGKEIKKLKAIFKERFKEIKTNDSREILKVALVGESGVLRDTYLNHSIEELLGGMGVTVTNFFLLGEELKSIFSPTLSKKRKFKVARPYLKTKIGGHALDTVAHSILCAEQNWDGIVHLAPSGCMPEISVRPVLHRAACDYDIPVLECSFDEHTSHVGMVTRLEAFVDMLYQRKNRAGANR